MFQMLLLLSLVFFFFNDTATTEIYTLSLHDALPIYARWTIGRMLPEWPAALSCVRRSEEHTSELQSRRELVCRLLLEKKKNECAAAAIETGRSVLRELARVAARGWCR